ncbi:hypothetical protein TRP8649_02845 [Pelagimonas phthalicica]|uniref:Uncharacterized protein n=1 Tax=Pelagimonas phthalicica TaxID=1037362 RepID=A0A238JDL2_9RHOB|nr:hypothetical protein CLV87_2847 [Pelagimonas phthalicica]SMX28719.1 hypothetical protein TRP8649_02845 [Pelagimonas phthalicica]
MGGINEHFLCHVIRMRALPPLPKQEGPAGGIPGGAEVRYACLVRAIACARAWRDICAPARCLISVARFIAFLLRRFPVGRLAGCPVCGSFRLRPFEAHRPWHMPWRSGHRSLALRPNRLAWGQLLADHTPNSETLWVNAKGTTSRVNIKAGLWKRQWAKSRQAE